jgi:signal transduction histidine kinase
VFELRPTVLDHHGLGVAVQEYVRAWSGWTSVEADVIVLGLDGDRLPAHVEASVYRIVQEALTNARRHASGAAVDVELRYADDVLRLRIRDNGPGPELTQRPGNGLLGMRERAAAAGGSLRTGEARPGGGFCVEAELPAKAPDIMTQAPK